MSDKDNKEKSNRGGVRAGAGRPRGSKSKISLATSKTVVEMLYDKTGQIYEEILIEDFLKARASNEVLAHKYHALLANKLMPDLQSIELTDSADVIEAKKQAFTDALASMIKNKEGTHDAGTE